MAPWTILTALPVLLGLTSHLLPGESHATVAPPRWTGTKRPFPRSTAPPEPDWPPDAKRLVRLRSGRKLEVEVRRANLTRRRFAFPPPEEIPTLFELLDDVICNALRSPEVGFAEKLRDDVRRFEEYLQKAKLMFVDKAEKRLEALRYSVYRLATTRGGPSFTRIAVDEPAQRRRLAAAFRWGDDDLAEFRARQEAVGGLWGRVEMNMFDVGRLRGNGTEAGGRPPPPLPTVDPARGHIFLETGLHDIYIP